MISAYDKYKHMQILQVGIELGLDQAETVSLELTNLRSKTQDSSLFLFPHQNLIRNG